MKISVLKPVLKSIENHISKSRLSDSYSLKTLILADVVMDAYGNAADYVNISKNKNIPEKEKNYLKSYKIANGVMSCIIETVAGFLILGEATQKNLTKKLFGNIEKIDPLKYTALSKGIKAFSSIVIATVIAKRIIVPFIVTPLTSVINNKMNKDK
jgi:hypothetical protein